MNTLAGSQRRSGFSLIELLVVVAIVGIIAALVVPNLLDSVRRAQQKRTLSDMRSSGTAWFSWLTDQAGAAAAGRAEVVVDWNDYLPEALADVEAVLVPAYAARIPPNDGWGNPYEFGRRANLNDLLSLAIRSPGYDGEFESDGYVFGTFPPTDYKADIVWTSGYFIRAPSTVGAQVEQ